VRVLGDHAGAVRLKALARKGQRRRSDWQAAGQTSHLLALQTK
jgi:hypothetical protein